MRKTLGITLTTAALMFGGAGIANATESVAPMPSSTTTLAQEAEDEGSDNTGLWGLAGLLGLVGLAGLKRRKDQHAVVNTGTAPGYGNTPRA